METTGKPYTNQPTNLRQRRRVSQNGNCNIGVVIAAEADEGVASASIREFSHGQTEASMVGVCLSIIDLFKHSWAVSHVLLEWFEGSGLRVVSRPSVLRMSLPLPWSKTSSVGLLMLLSRKRHVTAHKMAALACVFSSCQTVNSAMLSIHPRHTCRHTYVQHVTDAGVYASVSVCLPGCLAGGLSSWLARRLHGCMHA